jgi:uncharacterized SAM-binding protein YcdF (DUF218 family)
MKALKWTALLVLVLGGSIPLLSRSLLLPQQPLAPAEAIVVLGSGPPVDKDGRPQAELKRRVAQGVKVFQQGLAPVLVMTGGNTYLNYYEADVMRDAAVKLGVPESAIRREREARDTIGNARGTINLLCQGKERSTCAPSVIVVSSPYHLQRAKMLFECGGAKVQTSAAAPPPEWTRRLAFTLHEYQVRFNYLWLDECARVRGAKGPD